MENFFVISIGIAIEIENKGNTNMFDPDFDGDFDPERDIPETIKA